jgi:fatty acid desaturase
MLFVVIPNSWSVINGHVSGMAECYSRKSRIVRRPSRSATLRAHRLAISKYARYLVKEYVFWPMLAGPLFPKIVIGNFLAGTLRDIWSAAVILVGHPLRDQDELGPTRTRGEFYRRQVEATRNFTTTIPLAARFHPDLQFHTEHHLFPKLPFHRLEKIAPRVRAICEEHGVRYTTQPLGEAIRSTLGAYFRLSFSGSAARAVPSTTVPDGLSSAQFHPS